MSPTVLCVIGTRPEAIKMAPVVHALRERGLEAPVLATAQHRELLDQMLRFFHLSADWDMDAMRPNQDQAELTGRLVPGLTRILREQEPAAVLAQGDTTTVFCTALAAYYAGVPFGHVEAGLRSGDIRAPFPEEGMRRLTAVLARWHFAPTEASRSALLSEGIPAHTVHLVGNPVIDALLGIARQPVLPWPAGVPEPGGRRVVLVTLHRRENFGEPLQRILEALRLFARAHPEALLVYPVHPNPHVFEPARRLLGLERNVCLLDPLDYPCLVNVLRQAYIVVTDSGGIQEEAPALGKPVLVARDVTERPEAVEAGGALLVGTDPGVLSRALGTLWSDPRAYGAMARPRFPYGDGRAAVRIAEALAADLMPASGGRLTDAVDWAEAVGAP